MFPAHLEISGKFAPRKNDPLYDVFHAANHMELHGNTVGVVLKIP